jgi:hypothetical protein
MSPKTFLRPRLILPVVALVAAVGYAAADTQPRTPNMVHQDAIWVYFASICAQPGDASDCRPIEGAPRTVFGSHDACADHRDAELARAANPRLLGSCLRQREA